MPVFDSEWCVWETGSMQEQLFDGDLGFIVFTELRNDACDRLCDVQLAFLNQ